MSRQHEKPPWAISVWRETVHALNQDKFRITCRIVPICLVTAIAGLLITSAYAQVSEYDFNPELKWGGRSVAVTISPSTNNIAIEAAASGGLYRTSDGGLTWSRINSFPLFAMEDVSYDPENENIVFTTTGYDGRDPSQTRAGIWQSLDAGVTWSRANVDFACTDRPMAFGIGVTEGTDVHQKIFIANECGVAYSNDSGTTWTNIDPTTNAAPVAGSGPRRFWNVATTRTGPDTVMAYACGADGVYRTEVTGSATPSWTARATGFPAGVTQCRTDVGSCRRCRLAISPLDPEVVFLTMMNWPGPGVSGGWGMRVYESDDGGATWEDLGGPVVVGRPGLVQTNVSGSAGPDEFDLYWGNGVRVLRQPCTHDGDSTTIDCPIAADPVCTDAVDNDGDGLINEGCPKVGQHSEKPYSAPSECKNAIDDDGDGRVNDGCPVLEEFGNGSHADPMDVGFDTQGSGCALLISNDGGMSRSTDCGVTWSDVNDGRRALQIYNVLGTMRGTGSSETDLYFGTQDNSFWYTLDNGGFWSRSADAEGFLWGVDREVPGGGLDAIRVAYVGNSGNYGKFSKRGFSDARGVPGALGGPYPATRNIVSFGNQRWAAISDDGNCPPNFRVYIMQPETGTQCANATDDDADGAVNDGCPAVGASETDAQCHDAADSDGDGAVNDGCSHIESVESGTECSNSVDDDGDGVVNDGCPVDGQREAVSNCGANQPNQCLNAADDDSDGKVNDGCDPVGVWGPMGPTFTEARRDPLVASGPETSPTFYFGVDTGNAVYRLRKLSGPMNASATLSWATGSGTDTLEDVGLHGAQFYWPLVFGVDPGNPMRLYAADDATQQMKYSDNGGNTWSVDAELTDLVTNKGEFGWNPFGGAHVQPTVITYDPADPQRILVGTMHAGVVMSIDGGANWFTVNDTLNRVSWVNSFFFDEDHDIIYASTYGRGLWAIEITDVPPVALCTNVTVPTDAGICSADASIDNGSYDPDGGAVTLGQNPPGPYHLGATAVTLTVTDSAGYSDTCTATVTVVDVEPPAITCPADVTIECDEATDPSNTGTAIATDNCDPSPTIGFSDVVTPGACPQESTISRTWTATDASGNLSSCLQTIDVVDTTAPTLGVVLDPNVLWPPNHKYWTITATITATDNCDVDPEITLISITSNEPDNSTGDGNTTNDVRDADVGTDDREFQLRAERRGGGDRRVYTITYLAADDCGNSTETAAEVRVPHDQSGTAFAWSGFAADGTGLDPHATQWSLLIPSSAELDATSIDAARAYVGNFLGVQTPVDIEVVDYRQDGLVDLILVYDARETRDLLALSNNRLLGLHYQASDGTDYSITDVMELVPPDPEPPLLQASGDPGVRGTGPEVVADPQ